MRGRDAAVWSADGVLPGAGDDDGGAAVGAAAVFDGGGIDRSRCCCLLERATGVGSFLTDQSWRSLARAVGA